MGGEDRLVFDILNGKMSIQPLASEVTLDAIIRAVAQTYEHLQNLSLKFFDGRRIGDLMSRVNTYARLYRTQFEMLDNSAPEDSWLHIESAPTFFGKDLLP